MNHSSPLCPQEANASLLDGLIDSPACEPVLPVELDPNAEEERIDEFFESWIDLSETSYLEAVADGQ